MRSYIPCKTPFSCTTASTSNFTSLHVYHGHLNQERLQPYFSSDQIGSHPWFIPSLTYPFISGSEYIIVNVESTAHSSHHLQLLILLTILLSDHCFLWEFLYVVHSTGGAYKDPFQSPSPCVVSLQTTYIDLMGETRAFKSPFKIYGSIGRGCTNILACTPAHIPYLFGIHLCL